MPFILISFDGDAENILLPLFANSNHIYLLWLLKIEVYLWVLESQTSPVLSHLIGETLQDGLYPTLNFKDQDLTDKDEINRCKSP